MELAQKAIAYALNGKWEKAIEINKQILKHDPEDIDALNRLARAWAEMGNLTKAKKTAQKVLKIDPFNTIATKSLKKWKGLKKDEVKSIQPSSANAFLEEPGKTKIVTLIHLGDQKKVLAKLNAGNEVELKPHAHRISVTTKEGDYIGRLPDDLSSRLRKLIQQGNEYQILIKSSSPQEIKVFIRETRRVKALANTPSF